MRRTDLSFRVLLLVALPLASDSVQAQSLSQTKQALQARKVEGGINRVRARQLVDEDGSLSWDYTILGRNHVTRAGGTPSPAAPRQRKALVNCFQNTIWNGFFSVGTNGTEWMDWACKKAGKTDIVGAFAFAYASNARGLSEPGGTGASIGVSFYSGTTGFCARGARAGDGPYFFSALPGATGTQISPAFMVTATLNQNAVFCLPDGKIGWGYFFNEPPVGTNQNATGTLLSALHSNTCWSDSFDLWSSSDPIASCAGVFFFGGCTAPLTFIVPNPCAGFWIQIFEQTAVAGFSTVFTDTSGQNPIRYTEVQPANLGEAWITNILVDPQNPAGTEVAGVIRFGLPGTPFSSGVPLAFLVNASRVLVLGSAVNITVGGPGNPMVSSLTIPKDLGFLGSVFHTQAFGVILAGGVKLQALNGLSITIGAI